MDKEANRDNHYLVVATWNANGLSKGQFKVFLDGRDVSAMLVTGAHLQAERG